MSEYCANCSDIFVEEYDPAKNWKVPSEFGVEFTAPTPCSSPLNVQLFEAPPAPTFQEPALIDLNVVQELLAKVFPLPQPTAEVFPLPTAKVPLPKPAVEIIPRRIVPAPAPTPVYTPMPSAVSIAQKEKISKFIETYDGDLFNASAVFILRKMKVPINLETKRFTHEALRDLQLKSCQVSRAELSAIKVRGKILDAIKKYDKSIFNLSPVWVLRLAKEKETIGHLLEAINAIDSFLLR